MTEHTHFPPKVATGSFKRQDTLVLDAASTPRQNRCSPPVNAATELANMKAWLAGVAKITVTRMNVVEREGGNRYRPFRQVSCYAKYRTYSGAEHDWDCVSYYLPEGVKGARLEWWHYHLFISDLLKRRFPCTRCEGQADLDGEKHVSVDVRFSATCNRCWGRRTDPAVTELIRRGGDPSKCQIIHTHHD